MTNKNISAGVLGAGISGLATAWFLQKKGYSVTVYEKSAEAGGAIKTVREGNWLVEEGPNTLMIKSQLVWDLLDELDLRDYLMEANRKAARRYVVKNDAPVALPDSVLNFLKTPLLSAAAKLRLLKEPFVPASEAEDESIACFIRRRLGSEPLDYAVNPFVSGVYAGDPEQLSVKHTFSFLRELEQKYGSLLKGMIKREKKDQTPRKALVSFTNGNQMLPAALAEALEQPVHFSTEIQSAEKAGEGWIITARRQGEQVQAVHDLLISTLPATTLPDIFGSASRELSSLPYAPVSSLALGFEAGQIGHPLDGFGMLIPEIENFNTLGVLFSSTLFPERAPVGHQLLTCFTGGARNPRIASKPTEELQQMVLEELSGLLGISGGPVFTHHRYWKKAIPQYRVGYDRYLELIDELEKNHKGLFLAGNFRGGVSVPDCIASAAETAEKVSAFLKF